MLRCFKVPNMAIRYPVADPRLNPQSIANVEDCVASHWISSSGTYVRDFEQQFAQRFQSKHAITCSNGTMAIELALTALGVGPGDEVIVPNFTFVGSISPIYRVHATPVLVPPAAHSWNMDPLAVERAIGPKTKAIIAVHLYGHPCDIVAIAKLAKAKGLALIEDSAEALGAKVSGQTVGTFGDVGCFSFFGNKVLTTGEGGMCITNDATLAEKIIVQKNHGMRPSERYWHRVIGHNGRMTNLQAAVGLGQLASFDEDLNTRQNIEDQYWQRLEPSGFFRAITKVHGATTVNWLTSPVLKKDCGLDRDDILLTLKNKGIDSRPFFYPVSCMPAFSRFGHHDPSSHDIAAHGFNLPTYLDLKESDIEEICRSLIEACEGSAQQNGPRSIPLKLPGDQSTLSCPEVSLIVPTLNAGDNILELIGEARKQWVSCSVVGEILILDDGSVDGSLENIKTRYAHDPSVILVEREGPASLGAALQEGYGLARGKTIIFMDGNGNHKPEVLAHMVRNSPHYQIVSASRFTAGGRCTNPLKRLLSQNFNRLVRLLLGLQTRDNTYGYLCIQAKALQQLNSNAALATGANYGLHLMFQANNIGMSLLEVPTTSQQKTPKPSDPHNWRRLKAYLLTVHELCKQRFKLD
jgi:perosamine synthetase